MLVYTNGNLSNTEHPCSIFYGNRESVLCLRLLSFVEHENIFGEQGSILSVIMLLLKKTEYATVANNLAVVANMPLLSRAIIPYQMMSRGL